MSSIEIRFPAPSRAISTNEANKMHWAARKRELDSWGDMAVVYWWSMRSTAAARAIKGQSCDVQVYIPFATKRRRDPSNYVGTIVKAIVDGITCKGKRCPSDCNRHVWPDDDPRFVHVLEPILIEGTDCIVRLEQRETI